MIGTLLHRAKTTCSGPLQLQKEEHLCNSLKKCKYPTWALNRVKLRSQAPAPMKNKGSNKNPNSNNSRDQKPHITIPYHHRLSESSKRTCKKYDIEVHLKGGPTIKNLLMNPKDKDPILKKVGSNIDSNATGWSVMKNILGSQQEILERGLRNI